MFEFDMIRKLSHLIFLRLGNRVLPLIVIFSILFTISTEKVFGKIINATGSGFFLGSSNYIITNYHLIHNSEKIQVQLFNGELLEAEVILRKPDKDIAILKLNATPDLKRVKLKISDFFEVKNKSKIFTYGYPIIDALSIVEAKYSEGRIHSIELGKKRFQMDLAIQSGNSGGPVFNEKGKLIGVITSNIDPLLMIRSIDADSQKLSSGIKSSVLASLLPEIPAILQFDKGVDPIVSEQLSIRDFKKEIKKNVVFINASIKDGTGNYQVVYEAYDKGNFKLEFEQFKLLADQGNAEGQFGLGLLYEKGKGVNQDYRKAIHWWLLAAEQGYAKAQYNLGLLYKKGKGVNQDYKKAIHWWLLAAEQGYTKAQYNLGLMYALGRGVIKDYIEADKWASIAIAYGNVKGEKVKEIIESSMSRSEKIESGRLVEEWLRNHNN